MTEQEIKANLKAGKYQKVQLPPPTSSPASSPNTQPDISQFLIVLSALRRVRKHFTTAPTLTPKNFLDQIQFYDDGTHQRAYFYINNTWRYVTLT